MAALLVATLTDEELRYHISNRGTFLLVERSATGSGQLRHLGMSPTATDMEDDMMERLLALSLAGILVAPPVGLASESALNGQAPQTASQFSGKLPLPPIPYLDTMAWINFGWEAKGPRMDTLLMPPSDVPAIPKNSAFATNNSANAGGGDSQ
jgi:hypothetical protein